MFCGACGAFNEDGRTTCKVCGADLLSYVSPMGAVGAPMQAPAPQPAPPMQPRPAGPAHAAVPMQPAGPAHAAAPMRPTPPAPMAPVQPVSPAWSPAQSAGPAGGAPAQVPAQGAAPAPVPAAKPAPAHAAPPKPVPDVPRSYISPHVTLVRDTGARITISDFPATLGKGSAASVRIEGNNAVSRVHALVTFLGTFFAIEDKGSTNGTYLNGNVLGPGEIVKLHNGDTLTLGNEDFKVQVQ